MSHVLLLAAALITATPVDFDTDVLPILTKAGCNSGACHGAAAGRGGLKLSLFAGNPAADHVSIVHDLEGRRVNLERPEKSLVLAKPTGQLSHEGGDALNSDSSDVRLIEQWIREGAQRLGTRKIRGLRVTPANLRLPDVDQRPQITVTAEFHDGESRDVTRFAIFTPADPGSILVDDRGRLRVLRPGWHTVAVRFLTELRSVDITIPLRSERPDYSPSAKASWIDEFVLERLAELNLPVSPQANDATLLRRIHLDLVGRVPRTTELHDYLDAGESDKYEQLVDRLLESDEFIIYWTYRVARWLQVPMYAVRGDSVGADVYHAWLRQQLAAQQGWDHIARELLMAVGDTHQVGPANFHRQAGDARSQAELVAGAFLGVEMRCANCHNHPLDKWTQDDYHGLAAIFARLDRNRTVALKPRGVVTHPGTGAAAVPRLPGGDFITNDDSRQEFSVWLTSPENPYFSRAIANRIWKELMGRGLVEPADGIRSTNPASHPALLDRLSIEMQSYKYRLQPMIRTIVTSAVYRRSSQALPSNREDDRFYSHALRKPLSPEVYVDAVNDVAGVVEPSRDGTTGQRSFGLLSGITQNADIAVVSGCTAGERCFPAEAMAIDLVTRLKLLNGEFLNAKLLNKGGFLAQLVDQNSTNEEIVVAWYERALSRRPTEMELAFWTREIGEDKSHRHANIEDFCWSLLNCQEFITNH